MERKLYTRGLRESSEALALLAQNEDNSFSVIIANAADYIDNQAGEIERLEAIVNKLPKTADDVPVVPGETYYATWCDGETWPVCECMYVGHARPHVDYDWEIEGWPFDCEDSPEFSVWSTREAAEAAKESEL